MTQKVLAHVFLARIKFRLRSWYILIFIFVWLQLCPGNHVHHDFCQNPTPPPPPPPPPFPLSPPLCPFPLPPAAFFPSLREGILLNEGEITDVVTPPMIARHWQMADYSSSLLRSCLIEYFKPTIREFLRNDDAYEDVLVIHLRGGDALDEWAQTEWRPSPASYEFYQDAIERSGLERVLIVTTPPENGRMHPLVERIRSDYGAEVQHTGILEDFSVLMNCTNLILDFSTFGYTAALMNTNLKKVFISKYVDKQGKPLLRDIADDVGFTMPEMEGCQVYVYDHPSFIVKSPLGAARTAQSDS